MMFPDPSTSPAHYTRAIFICSSTVVMAVDVEAGGWIRGFSRVVRLLNDDWDKIHLPSSGGQRCFNSVDSHPLSNLSA